MTIEATKSPNTIKRKVKTWAGENLLLVLTMAGIVIGISLGLVGQSMQLSKGLVVIPTFLGEIMIRMLNMLILPLVVSSTITGLANLNKGSSSKICLYSMVYYLSTTAFAAIFGTLMATALKPGDTSILNRKDEIKFEVQEEFANNPDLADTIMDIIRNLFPDNLVGAAFQSTKTFYISTPNGNGSINVTDVMMKKSVQTVASPNIIGLIIFSGIFGSIVGQMKDSRAMVDFFTIMNNAIMKMLELIMWYTPFGIMCLLIGQMMNIQNMSTAIHMLGMYVVTNIVCCLIHGMITLPAIYYVITRKNPLKLYRGIMQAMITAFGTNSSLMTLPITKRCLEENVGVDYHITNFVLPIGTNINMDGATFHSAIVALFIASINGIDLGIGQLIMVSISAAVASIGMVGLPDMGITYLLLVLVSVNLPTEHITLLFAVDWIAGRFRTMINVLGDCIGCGIVDHICSKDLSMDVKDDHSDTNSAHLLVTTDQILSNIILVDEKHDDKLNSRL